MIKISYIIGRLAYGGAERLLLDICRKIDKTKFEVEVLVLQSDNPLAEQFEHAGVQIKYFNKVKKFDWKIIKKVADYLQKSKPDIVHTNLFAADFWGGRAAIQAKVKHIISTKHDILSEGFWRDRLGLKARRKFNKVVAISKATRDYLVAEEGIDIQNIEVIYNGIDVSKFYIENPGLFKTEDITIGSVGRLSKQKGHKHLIRACRFLKNKNWKLILVGDGPLRRELTALAKSLGIEDRVQFVGEVEDVRPHLNKFDVFVLPSVSEGLSLVILEAAAAGRVVVATEVGGVPEIIKHKQNGLLFKPKNIEQLVQRLNWVDEHRDLVSKMAKSLQQFVVDQFDVNKTIKQYQKLYEDIVDK